jgi:hypothetical protein
MRLPETAHTSRPWRIHEFTRDYRVEDVWALPTPGGPNDFPRLVELMRAFDPSRSSSRAVRWLFATRWKIGGLFGWDRSDAEGRETLRDRLPEDLREAAAGPAAQPFRSLYLLEDEWAAEIVNRTMHGVMHIGWVAESAGEYRGQMAVLVKPNGRFGAAYMAVIAPFRHRIVYPRMLRELGRLWQSRSRASPIPSESP